jgi:class 3 adenylate cyclase
VTDAGSLADLDKRNRALARKLERLQTNMRQLEEIRDMNSKLLSNLMRELDEERTRSKELLLNILPLQIVERLESGETLIADRYESVSVLMSDLVGFTSISSRLEPKVLVSELNRLFSEFDAICAETGMEKIKTIGDAYMAVGGLPGTRADHVAAAAEMSLSMMDALGRMNEAGDNGWQIRIGLHTGPAVAGVIGTWKFVYDVWGDTVNMASRLESSSLPDHIQVSAAVAQTLGAGFRLEPRGIVELKGKGDTETMFLRGRSTVR